MEHKFISAANFVSTLKSNVSLHKDLWLKNTISLLLAPRDANKANEALKIAADLSMQGIKVLYVNTERNAERHHALVRDVDNLSVFTPRYSSPDDPTDYADLVFDALRQAVATTKLRTFIIDSISRIAALSFGRNSSPAYLMKRLADFQIRYEVSVLVLAHTSTRAADNALRNLADSTWTVEQKPATASETTETKSESTQTQTVEIQTSQPTATPVVDYSRKYLSPREISLLTDYERNLYYSDRELYFTICRKKHSA